MCTITNLEIERSAIVIDQGKKVVIFPTNVEQKDINDMVLAGHDIMNMLGSNVYQGLTAKIKYNEWKRL